MPRFSLFLALLCLPLVVGCEGCRRGQDDAEEEAAQPITLDEFTATVPSAFPADLNPLAGGLKPGHWTTASQPLKSNKVDARGELVSQVSIAGERFQTGTSQTFAAPFPSVRPAVLPKGQLRRFDYRVLVPPATAMDSGGGFLSSRFVSPGRAVYYDTGQQRFNVLDGREYFFVILTSRPQRFAKFQVADWVQPPRDDGQFQARNVNYRVVIPPIDNVLPLSETMLDWTATAVLVWDDLSPDALTPAQQKAIADWVRFGGLFVVNGANAADAIAATSLAGLLPLKPTGNIELDPDAAIELLRGHAVATDPSTEKQITLVTDQSARLAVDGIAAQDTVALPNSGELVLQRMIGRGRVIQARFDLTSDWLANWLSYNSFVNSVILRRPRRRYDGPSNRDDFVALKQMYPRLNSPAVDATVNSQVRITARDAILHMPGRQDDVRALASRHEPLTQVDSTNGVTAWNDNSDTIAVCRQILRDESGIQIPNSSLVIRSLGYYLLILVPVNYLIFRMLGRLEYAWLAVPVIAIGGAVWVARAARLDIGFARSQTQLALLEMHRDYPRGHLSRVVAIYNSLSSTYAVQFNHEDGAATMIESATASSGAATFRTGFDEGPSLGGITVGSNQVRMLHCEEMIDMGGAIRLTEDGQLINETNFELFDAYVIEKSAAGEVHTSVLGSCASGGSAKLDRRAAGNARMPAALPMQADRLMGQLAAAASLPEGTARLVARIDAGLPGMTVTPTASQSQAQTVVLAHLKYPDPPAPRTDDNLISDFIDVLSDESGDQQDQTDKEHSE